MSTLKDYLKADWKSADNQRLRHYWQGCWHGVTGHIGPEIAPKIESLLKRGDVANVVEVRSYLDNEAMGELRAAMVLPTSAERLSVFKEAADEYAAEKKLAGKEFARQKFERLVSLGLSPKAASAVMAASGPGRVEETISWAKYALGVVNSTDALDCLLSGARGTNRFGKNRMEGALRAFGLEPPQTISSAGLFKILEGAREFLLAAPPDLE